MRFTVLAYGSASTVQANLAAFGFAILAILSTLHPIGSWRVGRVQAVSILVLAGLVGYAAFQTLPLAGLGLRQRRLEVGQREYRPGERNHLGRARHDARRAVVAGAAVPRLHSRAGLLPGRRRSAVAVAGARLFRRGLCGVRHRAGAALSRPTPLRTEKYYVGYLTATFVNRNTAGTFFGLALLLNLGLEFHELRKIRIASFVKKALDFDIGWRDKNALALVHAFCCLIVAMALFLTQSRGAVGATFIACVAAVALITTRRLTADKARRRIRQLGAATRRSSQACSSSSACSRCSPDARCIAWRSREARTGAGAPSPRRSRRSRTIGSSARGLAPSKTYFPLYRDSDCAGIFGVWERAHNFFLEGFLGLGLPFRRRPGDRLLGPDRRVHPRHSNPPPIPLHSGDRTCRADPRQPAFDRRFFAANSRRRRLFRRDHGGRNVTVSLGRGRE